MKRLGYIISFTLILGLQSFASVFAAETVFKKTGSNISDFHKFYRDDYLDFAQQSGHAGVLASTPNGCWAALVEYAAPVSSVKPRTQRLCNASCNTTCEIVDVGGKSDFVKSMALSDDSPATPSSGADQSIELEFWQTVKDNDDLEMYQAYLESYPNGQFVSLATSRIEELTPKPKSEVDKKKDTEIELEFWKSVRDSGDPDLLQAYLDEYPNGHFAIIAKIKIKKLKSSGTND